MHKYIHICTHPQTHFLSLSHTHLFTLGEYLLYSRRIHTDTYMHIYTHTYIHICAHPRTHTLSLSHTSSRWKNILCTHAAYTQIHIHTDTRTHTYTYAHTHPHTLSLTHTPLHIGRMSFVLAPQRIWQNKTVVVPIETHVSNVANLSNVRSVSSICSRKEEGVMSPIRQN